MTALGEASGPRPSRLGRYELISKIGHGGMAEVQLALQRGPAGFEKLVVVKLVHEHLATQTAFVDMLLDEARMAALVKHPNVVDIYDLGQADGRYFIAMEYLEGEPLLAVLRAGREGKRLDPLSTGRLIADTADGLDAAHELRTLAGEPLELVHHDISLGNIVILYSGQVKLVDFGVAKATRSAGPRAKVQGKFSYMAPEKLRGGLGDRRSDIWSLGCVLWEALTLRRLFRGGNDAETMRLVLETSIARPSTVNPSVPPDFDRIVMKALEREPARRYATAKAMASDLEEVLRQHKYGGKNELIATYMQATFAAHIAARKQLLQEVSSKGNASEEILEAAFTEPAETPVPSSSALSGRVHQLADPRDASAASRARSDSFAPGTAVPGRALPWRPVASADEPPRAGAAPSGARIDRRLVMAIGGGALLLVVLLALGLGGGDEHVAPGARADRPARDADFFAATVDAERDRPADPAEAERLFKAGMQAYVKGDLQAAVGAFRHAIQANANHADAWRALGFAHEKLGEWGQARTALQRYLALVPDAPDAPLVRERLDNL